MIETRTVWHPARSKDDPERYRNVPCITEDLDRLGLYYDSFGTLRERRGIDSDREWSAEVSYCRDCGRMWTDPREAHCVSCHQHFGGDKGAEMHFVDLGCRSPRDVKDLELVQRKFGPTWVRTDHLDNPERRAA
jgi:hypothetical protein